MVDNQVFCAMSSEDKDLLRDMLSLGPDDIPRVENSDQQLLASTSKFVTPDETRDEEPGHGSNADLDLIEIKQEISNEAGSSVREPLATHNVLADGDAPPLGQ